VRGGGGEAVGEEAAGSGVYCQEGAKRQDDEEGQL
jgi:hypothetical protein